MSSTVLFVCPVCGKNVGCVFILNRWCEGRCFLLNCIWDKTTPEIILTEFHEACKNPCYHRIDGHA